MAVWWQPLNLFWRHSAGAEGSFLTKWKPFDVKNGVKTFNYYPHPIFGNLVIHWSRSFHQRAPAWSQRFGDFSYLTLCSNFLVQHCSSCLCGFIIIVPINFSMAGGIKTTCVLCFIHKTVRVTQNGAVPSLTWSYKPTHRVSKSAPKHPNQWLYFEKMSTGGLSQYLILKGVKICSETQ